MPRPLTPLYRYSPLEAEHPLVGERCSICAEVLEVGQRPSLMTGPPADGDEAERLRAGRPYTMSAAPAHETCAWAGWAELADALESGRDDAVLAWGGAERLVAMLTTLWDPGEENGG